LTVVRRFITPVNFKQSSNEGGGMKKILVVVLMFLFIAVPAFADSTHETTGGATATATASPVITNTVFGGSATSNATGGTANANATGGQGGSATATIAKGAVTNSNTAINTNLNSVVVDPKITVDTKLTNMQKQGQAQVQGQKQSVNNNQVIAPSQEITFQRDYMDTPIVPSVPLPMVQGRIFDYTSNTPNFVEIKKLGDKDLVKSVVIHQYMFNLKRWFAFGKIYLEDIEPAIIGYYNDSKTKAAFRYKVLGKDNQESHGLMLGGASAGTASNGGSAQTGTGGLGVANSNADPTFLIYVYEVK
jgi:hypothetical protein